MDYADAVASFFDPLPTPLPVPRPTQDASPARRLRDAIEPIAMHAVWSAQTNARLSELGLNFLTSYVWGRAASLGVPAPGVVASTFAVFQPDLVTSAYCEGRDAVDRDTMLVARAEATIESLRGVLTEPGDDVIDDVIDGVAAQLRTAVTSISGLGRPLFSGLRDQAWPTDPVGVLWRSCELAREHRGDGHVAICLADGLDAIEMNILTELYIGLPLGSYSASRAWGPDQIAEAADGLRAAGLVGGNDADTGLTDAGIEYRREIEARTDALDQPLIQALGGQSGVDAVLEPLRAWSQQCIDARAFPPDPYKRAAG